MNEKNVTPDKIEDKPTNTAAQANETHKDKA